MSWSTGDAWLETREHDERRPITCFDHPIVTTAEPKPIVRDRPLRWIGLTIGVAISAVDMVIASVLGITFAISDSDATTAVWAYLAVSFGVLGYLIGWLMESRRREQHAVARVREQMNTLRGLQIGLAEREKLAALGQLAATIAHEVRNPLAIIRSTLQNITEEIGESRPAIAEQYGFLLEEIDRLNRVVTTVLDYARPMRLDIQTVTAAELFDRVELLASGLLAPKQLALQRLDSDIALHLDADLMCQALLGLLANGVEATPDRTSLTLAAQQRNGGVELSVADCGPGVGDDVRNKIFEPFFTTKSSGSGLGLSVAKRIAEAHDGTIAVEKRPDGGARFIMHLPQKEA
ncbi:MAG: ATP-binding protein [Proteobacteria bacterium]|nr:ATP-binding protein [Pseudomonadota bacterium]